MSLLKEWIGLTFFPHFFKYGISGNILHEHSKYEYHHQAQVSLLCLIPLPNIRSLRKTVISLWWWWSTTSGSWSSSSLCGILSTPSPVLSLPPERHHHLYLSLPTANIPTPALLLLDSPRASAWVGISPMEKEWTTRSEKMGLSGEKLSR